MADLSPTIGVDAASATKGVDTLYVADDGASAFQKFNFDGTNWVSKGIIGVAADAYRGVTGVVSGSTVTLYASRKNGELVRLVDSSGFNGAFAGTPTTLASATANTVFRGTAIVPDDGAPLVEAFGGTTNYTAGGSAVIVNGSATFTDLSNFKGGTLTVSYVSGSGGNDTLSINNQGTAAGQIGFSGGTVTYGGNTIGTAAGGANGTSLTITFNGNAAAGAAVTKDAIQALLRQITFSTTAGGGAGNRVLNFKVSQADGKVSTDGAATQQTVNVAAGGGNQSPTFVNSGPFSINENSTTGATVGTVTATDLDPGQTATLVFDEVGTGTGAALFQISSTGDITVQAGANLDFETTNVYTYDVKVTDTAAGTTQTSVTINLNDINDAPVFGAGAIVRLVQAGATNGTVVAGGAVIATDPDAGGSVTNYTITGGNTGNAFAISPTGVLSVNDETQVVVTGSFTLQITATDNNSATSLAKSVTVNVVNNDPPVVTPDTFAINENSAANTNVGTPIITTDSNSGDGDLVTFSITGGNGTGAGAFKINSAGQIQVNDATQLNFESTTSYALTVTATDLFGATGSATVTVNLNNVPEAPVVTANQSFTIAENSAAGTAVGVVAATFDATAVKGFNIVGGNGTGGGAFTIDANGLITIADASQIDFESHVNHRFSLSVMATDTANSLSSAARTVTVNLTNVHEGTVLSPGDVIVTGVDTDTDDEFTFVPLVDLAAGTEIRFTDMGWLSAGGFRLTSGAPSEGILVYVAPAGGVTAGTEIGIKGVSNVYSLTGPNNTVGSVFDEQGGSSFGLALDGDQVIVFQGTFDNPTPIFAVSTHRDEFQDATSPQTSAVPTGLIEGTTAVAVGVSNMTETDNAQYNDVVTTGTKAEILAAVANSDNWVKDDLRITLTFTNFTVEPDANLAPTDITLTQNVPLLENVVGTKTVGNLTATDANAGDTFTYVLVDGVGGEDNNLFTLTGPNGDVVETSTTFNYEAKSSYSILVQVTDSASNTFVEAVTILVTDVNEVPSFTGGGSLSVDEDDPATTITGWATNIFDGDDGTQTLDFQLLVSNPALFSVQPNVDPVTGDLTFTVAPDVFDTAIITIHLEDDGGTANDGDDASEDQIFSIVINAVNDPPTFVLAGDPPAVDEDAGLVSVPTFATNTSPGAANESDQQLHFEVTHDDVTGLFSVDPSISEDGTLTYELAPNKSGSAMVTVVLKDDAGGDDTSAPQFFTITVNPVNDAPEAGDNTVTATEDVTYKFSAGDFPYFDVENDLAASITIDNFSLGGGTLLYNGTPATEGSEILLANIGLLKYAPAADAFGTAIASFTFTVNDADAGTVAGTLTIDVDPVNDVPSFDIPVASVSVDEDEVVLPISGFATNISTGAANENQQLTFLVNPSDTSLFTQAGQPKISEDGTLTFTLALNANGGTIVSVSLTDGEDTSVVKFFAINVNAVNDAPEALASNITTDEETPYPFVATDFKSSDVENDTIVSITIQDLSNLNGGTLQFNDVDVFEGQVILVGDIFPNLVYTPGLNETGEAGSFTFTANDADQGTVTGTMTLNVTNINDVPVATDNTVTTAEDVPYHFSVSDFTFDDVENDDLVSITLTNVLNLNGTLVLTGVGPVTEGQVILAADIDDLVYTPEPEQSSPAFDSFTFAVNDGDLGSAATLTIDVTAVNDLPTFDIPAAAPTVSEDASTQSFAFATNISTGAANENQTLTFSVTNNTNTALFETAPSISPTGVLTYKPAANKSGTATISVKLSDGVDDSVTKTFTITVTEVNDLPTFDIPATAPAVQEDAATVTIPFATNISAGPNETQTLTFMVTGNTNLGLFETVPSISPTGVLTYKPAGNANGTAIISVKLSDGVDNSTTKSFTITVNAVNDPPTFTIPATAPTVLEDAGPQTVNNFATGITAGGGESQTLTFTTTGNSNPGLFLAGPTLDSTGKLTYTPAAGASGSATITVKLSDGVVVDDVSKTFTINVTNVNDTPSFTVGPNQTVAENSPAQSISGFATNISPGLGEENSGQTIEFIVTPINPSLFSVPPAIDASGKLTYTLAADANGATTVNVAIQDAGGLTSPTQSFTITVTPVNTLPTFTLGQNQSIPEGQGPQSVPGFASANPGPANENQTVSFNVSNDNNALFADQPIISANGTLIYTPADGAQGTATVTVTATDGDGGTSTTSKTFTITITNVAPTVSFTGPTTAVPGLPLTFTINASDPSTEDQAAGFTYTINWGDGTAVENVPVTIGTLSREHAYDSVGTFTVTITATDKDGSPSAPQTSTVTVTQTAIQPGGFLYIGGTKGADKITITAANSTGKRVTVRLNNKVLGTFTPKRIYVYPAAGSDTVTTVGARFGGKLVTPNIPLRIYGAAGNDTINVSANRGQAVILGNAGNDTLIGSSARDILIGNTGKDILKGGGGDDILIGGTTDYDPNFAALDALMAVWGSAARTQTYAKRVNAITKGTATLTTPLNATTVHDDKLSDSVTGGGGRDLYFATLAGSPTRRDKLTGVVTKPAAAKETVVKTPPAVS